VAIDVRVTIVANLELHLAFFLGEFRRLGNQGNIAFSVRNLRHCVTVARNRI
jgi:hypothetical protein